MNHKNDTIRTILLLGIKLKESRDLWINVLEECGERGIVPESFKVESYANVWKKRSTLAEVKTAAEPLVYKKY